MEFKRTVHLIHKLITEHIVPGAAYAFYDGQQWRDDIFGNRQWVPEVTPLTKGLTYDVASLTKVVATLPVILQLIEEDRLGLDDSISQYLPEWQFPAVRVSNLLTHTSGITGYIPHRDALNHAELTAALVHQLHVGPDLNHKMVYADVNFIFLGWIAERILGQPIQQLAVQRVFQPLMMNHSTFTPRQSDCVPTVRLANGTVLQGIVDDPKARVLGSQCGSAGLFSTISDLIKFTDEMLHPTGRILSRHTVNDLYHDHTANGELGRSYGWAFDHLKHPFIWQTGYTGTAIVIDPVVHHALILLTNRIHPAAPNEAFIPRRNQIIDTFLTEN
ncbi:beta-lactamase family protein [Nicoliella spurrieriana]|uniref:Beta-lactamase family protein n=1 Tax=Nicoliella spurrieriana TaxID=2925830 RepID=A0A976X5A8_9LACO|nr:serine hydrolase domain-containing protein [Nicoliella spurrieriana]UQS86848.1 beta-lactamase family protein [Nicoliella spurrieriana]